MIAYYGSALSPNMDRTPEGYLICRNVPINRTGEQTYAARELELPGDPEKPVTVYRMAEDEGTQEKSRIEIYKWIAEMALGKPSVSKPESTPTTGGSLRFEGELEDWAG